MRAIGFSTGSLAAGEYQDALEVLNSSEATAIELSALREHEFRPLIDDLPHLELKKYDHVSVHAPSVLHEYSESDVVAQLEQVVELGYYAIVHADVIQEVSLWSKLGRFLCIENMDKRKSTGRTVGELFRLFSELKEATFCLDVAHARQVDPTLSETVGFLAAYGDRVAQLHVSELNVQSKHERLSYAGVAALRWVRDLIPPRTPIILEFSAGPHELNAHMALVATTLDSQLPAIRRDVG